MLSVEAKGGVNEQGEPVVQILLSVVLPLKDADEIAKLVKQAGTMAVLAVGALNSGEATYQIPAHSHEGPHGDECVGEGCFTPGTLQGPAAGGPEVRSDASLDGGS